MNKEINDLLSNTKLLKDVSRQLINLSKYIIKEKPDICFIPLRGAFPLRVFVSYIIKRLGKKLPEFRFVNLGTTELISESFLKSLDFLATTPIKFSKDFVVKGNFNKVMLLDEVNSGVCWSFLISPLLFNLFYHINKRLKNKKLICSGISSNNEGINERRRVLFDLYIHSPFKLFVKYDYEPFNKLLNVIRMFEFQTSSVIPHNGLFALKEISDKIHSINDFKSSIIDVLVYLFINASITGILVKNLIRAGFNISKADYELFHEIASNSIKVRGEFLYIKLSEEDLNKLRLIVKKLILSNPGFFNAIVKDDRIIDFKVKSYDYELIIKTFNVKVIPFADKAELIGLDSVFKNVKFSFKDKKLPRFFPRFASFNSKEVNDVSKQFFLIMKLFIDKELRIKDDWSESLSKVSDEEFKSVFVRLLND